MSLYTWMIVGNFIFPFMNVLFPYLYWRQNRQTEDTAFMKEACNLLNFQILFSFIMIGVFVFGWYQAIVGWSMDEAASFGFMKWGLVVMTMVNIIYPLVVCLLYTSYIQFFVYFFCRPFADMLQQVLFDMAAGTKRGFQVVNKNKLFFRQEVIALPSLFPPENK